jgi:hypothetical protein
MQRTQSQVSPRVLSRIGGALYLVIIILGLVGEAVIRDRIIVSGDAAATAANIRSLEFVWRLGIASEFILLICAVALLPILYVLLRPVSPLLALLATFFDLMSLTVEATTDMSLLETLFPLGGAPYLRAFKPEQLNTMAHLAIKSHTYGFGVALIFFGCFCVIAGYLIIRSEYLPKIIGILMQVAGLCYLTNSFALILAPSVAARLFPGILIPAFIGETSLCLWLLIKGVNLEKWNAQASTVAM